VIDGTNVVDAIGIVETHTEVGPLKDRPIVDVTIIKAELIK
jgi:hypothetical protein